MILWLLAIVITAVNVGVTIANRQSIAESRALTRENQALWEAIEQSRREDPPWP